MQAGSEGEEISRQDQYLVHFVICARSVHVSMHSRVLVQHEVNLGGLRQQQADMTEPSATPQHRQQQHFAPADHLIASADADFGNPSAGRPR